MNFQLANAAYIELRNLLCSVVHKDAFGEITLAPPKHDSDELSFLRLAGWTYSFVYEAGRNAVRFLAEINPPDAGNSIEERRAHIEIIHHLRTWAFHSLGLDDSRDRELSRKVHVWFYDTCGKYPPNSEDEWRKCFRRLCEILLALSRHSMHVATPLCTEGDPDREAILDAFRRQISRDWAPKDFDDLLTAACLRLGISGLDKTKFRNQRLKEWQQLVREYPDETTMRDAVVRRIEKDLLDHARQMLPISSIEIMEAFELGPGPQLLRAIRIAHASFEAGVVSRRELLDCINRELHLGK